MFDCDLPAVALLVRLRAPGWVYPRLAAHLESEISLQLAQAVCRG